MKRLATILLLAALVACTKQPAPLASVVFSVGGIQTGDIATKGGAAELLAATAPTGFPMLTLTSTTNAARKYTATIGEPVALPLDTYNITGTYSPATTQTLFRSKAMAEPRYKISTTITISEGTTSYTLPATYDCFALIIDYSQAARYDYYDQTTSWTTINAFTDADGYGVAYINVTDWSGSLTFNMRVYPVETAEHEMAAYVLANKTTSGCTLVENGKWYVFSPNAVSKQSGDLGVTLPEWTAGQ